MFEFIEDIEVTAADHIRNIITGYRRHGFMTALDDLGAGHAGLGLLVDVQPDLITMGLKLGRTRADPTRTVG